MTFDGSNVVQPVKWTAVVLNGHYHLPVGRGKKLWVSGTYSRLKSDNALALTPNRARTFVGQRRRTDNVWWGVARHCPSDVVPTLAADVWGWRGGSRH